MNNYFVITFAVGGNKKSIKYWNRLSKVNVGLLNSTDLGTTMLVHIFGTLLRAIGRSLLPPFLFLLKWKKKDSNKKLMR